MQKGKERASSPYTYTRRNLPDSNPATDHPFGMPASAEFDIDENRYVDEIKKQPNTEKPDGSDWFVHKTDEHQQGAIANFNNNVERNAGTAYIIKMIKMLSATDPEFFNEVSSQDFTPPSFGQDQFHASARKAEEDFKNFQKHVKCAQKMREVVKHGKCAMGMLNEYVIGNVVGSGSTSEVCLAYNKSNKGILAAKFVSKSKLTTNEFFHRELGIMKMLDHKHVVCLHDIHENHEHVVLFHDYCDIGTLAAHMNSGPMPDHHAKMLFVQMAEGVQYLHETIGVAHRDIKPQKILLSSRTTDVGKIHVRIGGFDVACESKVGEVHKFWVGTINYMAPELAERKHYYAFPVDVWALGVTLYQMLTGVMPFDGRTTQEIMTKILNARIQYPDSISHNAKELLRMMLRKDDRVTIGQVKASFWCCTTEVHVMKPTTPAVAFIPQGHMIVNEGTNRSMAVREASGRRYVVQEGTGGVQEVPGRRYVLPEGTGNTVILPRSQPVATTPAQAQRVIQQPQPITEIPIRKWTLDPKQFLQDMLPQQPVVTAPRQYVSQSTAMTSDAIAAHNRQLLPNGTLLVQNQLPQMTQTDFVARGLLGGMHVVQAGPHPFPPDMRGAPMMVQPAPGDRHVHFAPNQQMTNGARTTYVAGPDGRPVPVVRQLPTQQAFAPAMSGTV